MAAIRAMEEQKIEDAQAKNEAFGSDFADMAIVDFWEKRFFPHCEEIVK
jgi:hypothetical protein